MRRFYFTTIVTTISGIISTTIKNFDKFMSDDLRNQNKTFPTIISLQGKKRLNSYGFLTSDCSNECSNDCSKIMDLKASS